MRSVLTAVLILCLCVLGASSPCEAAAGAKSLQIYFVDVEGGQATLVVTPSGQSLLIDTGWPGYEGRDADRILAAAHQAGITQLDYVLITHYHRDHVGGVPQLVDGIKVGTFLDHGPNLEDSEVTRTDYAAYEKAIAGHTHVVVKPGWELPIKGLQIQVLAAAGDHITHPLPGAGEANSYCGSEPAAAPDNTENARSVGVLITYGHFRFLDLGDLTKKKELEIACPNNLLGTVDLFLVTHHGADLSNPKALVWALHPRAAVIDNGPRKGSSPAAWQIVHDSPGLEDLWQLHYAEESDRDHNVAENRIANVKENCEGKFLKVAAEADGTFTVTNGRTGEQKAYGKK
ncbi:MAG TPA: MBL fold metallo-hydrolase [Candidatus Baltobacteraceae bacterium]|nr:MBL fold metallo-hydrolase [Candidatus Baltobacteraceae bacterium]